MSLNANYHDCKLEVKGIIQGSLSSFLWAYCKTINCPAHLEPYFIRKAISFVKLAKYVRANITNDFDGWYRVNEDSQTLCDVMATIINNEDGRTAVYGAPLVSAPFRVAGINMDFVLVSKS